MKSQNWKSTQIPKCFNSTCGGNKFHISSVWQICRFVAILHFLINSNIGQFSFSNSVRYAEILSLIWPIWETPWIAPGRLALAVAHYLVAPMSLSKSQLWPESIQAFYRGGHQRYQISDSMEDFNIFLHLPSSIESCSNALYVKVSHRVLTWTIVQCCISVRFFTWDSIMWSFPARLVVIVYNVWGYIILSTVK